jgi:hypothetical protein
VAPLAPKMTILMDMQLLPQQRILLTATSFI